ncbi:MAG TPA: tripartite tricarboxylate transporter substrate binding protein [Burkholderiales bacterium]
MSLRKWVLVMGTTAALCGTAQAAWPERPIRFMVGSVPGGTTDLVARAISDKMSVLLGQQLVVENHAGANQMIAAELTAKSPPDGYTLLMAPAGFTINPAIYKKMAYDTLKDFTPIGMVANVPNALVVSPQVPVKSVKELIALAQAQPGKLNYGSSGVGSPSHLSGALFELLAKAKMTHVPYKGTGPALTDLMAGHLEVLFPSIPGALPFINSHRMNALAVTTARRSVVLPDLPTIAESGVPGYDVGSWFAVVGPAGLPGPMVGRLNSAIAQTLAAPEVRKLFLSDGTEPAPGTPADLASTITTEIAKWKQVTAAAGIHAE